MYICVDFDGTIVDHRYPDIGAPVNGAVEWLKRFQELGAKIILFTVRSNDGGDGGDLLTQAVNYLREQGVELFGVNSNPTQGLWSLSPKAYGEIYIDDAAFGCPLVHPEGFARPCLGGHCLTRFGTNVTCINWRDNETRSGNAGSSGRA